MLANFNGLHIHAPKATLNWNENGIIILNENINLNVNIIFYIDYYMEINAKVV